MMRDGKALQMATSHELGQNFSRMFDISYSDQDGNLENVWQTSWGCSTRMVGGLIMAHGDEKGLVIPPKLAPTQVVILIVRDGEGVTEAAEDLKRRLAGELGGASLEGAALGGAKRGGASLQGASGGGEQKILIDSQTAVSFGRRSTDWEIKGVPVRVELGPRDVEEGVGVLVRRDTSEKTPVPLPELPQKNSSHPPIPAKRNASRRYRTTRSQNPRSRHYRRSSRNHPARLRPNSLERHRHRRRNNPSSKRRLSPLSAKARQHNPSHNRRPRSSSHSRPSLLAGWLAAPSEPHSVKVSIFAKEV